MFLFDASVILLDGELSSAVGMESFKSAARKGILSNASIEKSFDDRTVPVGDKGNMSLGSIIEVGSFPAFRFLFAISSCRSAARSLKFYHAVHFVHHC